MSNVTSLDVSTTLPIPVEKIIAEAATEHAERPFKRVTILAMYEDNPSEYFASSEPDTGTVLYDMDRLRHFLMKQVDDFLESLT